MSQPLYCQCKRCHSRTNRKYSILLSRITKWNKFLKKEKKTWKTTLLGGQRPLTFISPGSLPRAHLGFRFLLHPRVLQADEHPWCSLLGERSGLQPSAPSLAASSSGCPEDASLGFVGEAGQAGLLPHVSGPHRTQKDSCLGTASP